VPREYLPRAETFRQARTISVRLVGSRTEAAPQPLRIEGLEKKAVADVLDEISDQHVVTNAQTVSTNAGGTAIFKIAGLFLSL
jgi:hypothetical protein